MAFTYFFRDLQTLEQIVEHLMPVVVGRSKIRIWDAGCASGQEPYTLAILLAEKMGKYIFKNVEIFATDIDISNQFEKIIKDGIYPYQELQRVPPLLLEKYFRQYSDDGKLWQVVDLIRNKIIYKRDDLLNLYPVKNELSLVLCKNVLLHLAADERVKVIKMFHQSLTMGGLFATEQTQELPFACKNLFDRVVPNAQIFRKI